MGKYGLKIKNIEASTLYEYNLGIREYFEYTNAMLTNSLFFDFLEQNGMKTYKETMTRDIICLQFSYGTRSYDEQMAHLDNLLKKYMALNLPDSINKINLLKKILKTNQMFVKNFQKKKSENIFIGMVVM